VSGAIRRKPKQEETDAICGLQYVDNQNTAADAAVGVFLLT
jgi:hypothetical protein